MKAKYSPEKMQQLKSFKEKAEFVSRTSAPERVAMCYGIMIEILEVLERIEEKLTAKEA